MSDRSWNSVLFSCLRLLMENKVFVIMGISHLLLPLFCPFPPIRRLALHLALPLGFEFITGHPFCESILSNAIHCYPYDMDLVGLFDVRRISGVCSLGSTAARSTTNYSFRRAASHAGTGFR